MTTLDSPAAPPSARYAAATAVAGAALVLAGDAYHLFVLDDRPSQAGTAAYTGHGVAIMLGLLLLVLAALAVVPSGRLGRIARPLLVVGTALVVGDIWAEVVVLPGVVGASARELLGDDISGQHLAFVIAAFALFALGWVIFALAMRGVVGGIAWLLVVGAVLAFLPIGGSYVVLAVGAATVVVRARVRPDQRGTEPLRSRSAPQPGEASAG